MSEPTKPPTTSGFYWAKEAGDNLWVVVELFNGQFWMPGSVKPYAAFDFTFGPEVTKPEGME